MPYLSIQTNINASEEQRNDLTAAASKIIAAQLNKPRGLRRDQPHTRSTNDARG
jgi:hypothetical protein